MTETTANELWARYCTVQGLESRHDYFYITGNPPEPTAYALKFALVTGLFLLLLVIVLNVLLARGTERIGACRRHPFAFAFLRVLLLVLLFFVSWESELRILARENPFQVFVPDPVTMWHVNPLLSSIKVQKGHLYPPTSMKENYIGFSNEAVKEKGTFRIICLGDSQVVAAADKGNDKWHSYPKYLEKALRMAFPRRKLDVINGGVPGFTSFQGLRLLPRVVSDMQPDVVVLAYGYHDSNFFLAMDHMVLTDNRLVCEARRILYQSQIFIVLRKVLMRTQAPSYDESLQHSLYQRVPPEYFSRNYEDFMALAVRHGFRIVVFLEPHPAFSPGEIRRSEPYREAAVAFARKYGLPVADCFSAFLEVKGKEHEALFTDLIHLSSKGHTLAAKVLFKSLVKHEIPEKAQSPEFGRKAPLRTDSVLLEGCRRGASKISLPPASGVESP